MKEKIICECQKEIELVLNKYNTHNTLDFVLVKYLENCLKSFNDVITFKQKIDQEKLIDEIEEENGGAFINSNQSELESNDSELEPNLGTENLDEINIFDADEEFEEQIEEQTEENDNDFWNS